MLLSQGQWEPPDPTGASVPGVSSPTAPQEVVTLLEGSCPHLRRAFTACFDFVLSYENIQCLSRGGWGVVMDTHARLKPVYSVRYVHSLLEN